MVGFAYEDRSSIDYLGRLAQKAPDFKGVTNVEQGNGEKVGASSANIRRTGDGLIVEHSGRRVTIHTTQESFDIVLVAIKDFWRGALRGPKLVDRTQS